MVDVDDGVDAALDEVCEEELHVSGFVAAECEAGGVVAFDEEGRDGGYVGVHGLGDGGAESGHFLEGRVFVGGRGMRGRSAMELRIWSGCMGGSSRH